MEARNWVASIIGAALGIGIAIAVLLYFDQLQLSSSQSTPPPSAGGQSATRPAVPNQAESSAVRRQNPARVAPAPRIITRQQPQTSSALHSMMETCEFWSRQQDSPSARTYYEQACNRALIFAREERLPSPRIPAYAGTTPPVTRIASSQTTVRIRIDECEYLTVGSVAFRECRARESARLRRECQKYREQVQYASGRQAEILRARERAYCSAAERYRIVQ